MAYFIPTETESGESITEQEQKLIRELKRLESKWKKYGQRLWLYSGGGTLCVMLSGDKPDTVRGATNPDNIITQIDIRNDGGDW